MEIKVKQGEMELEQQKSFKPGLLGGFLNFFKAPADVPVMEDAEQVKSGYKHWRLRIFYAAFIGYVAFYLCKKNISVALPVMGKSLGYSNTELGLIGSTLYFTYAFGKFINGILADRSNARTFLPTALILSGIANICFVASSIFITPGKFTFFGLPSATILIWFLAFFWGCNGWFQSMGFPVVAKSLTYWYSNNERGMKWSLWSTSHQTGTFLSVVISGFVIAHFGWRAAFFIPAIISVIVSMFLFERLRDKPTTLGLPDIERYREPERFTECKDTTAAVLDDNDKGYFEIFKKYILCNKTMWMLAFAYIFVYIIRFGTEDWVVKYLVEAKHNSLETAAWKLSFLPLFGIIGTISAGYFSDKVFKGKRTPINVFFLMGVICAILGLKYNTVPALDFVFLGMIGIFTYGPQMLIGGLCAVESSSKKVASAATGFTGSFGYIGAIFSGIGTGTIIDKFGWNGALYFWIASAVICILLCLPMWNHKSSCK
jgi:MFS transporter, OPA family, sugar phosphate sensor protein UhpC